MNLEPFILFLIFAGTALIGRMSLLGVTTQWQRISLLSMLGCFFLYNGIGASYPEVPSYYLVYYFGFLLAFAVTFKFFANAFLPLSRRVGCVLSNVLKRVEYGAGWRLVIPSYFALNLILLVYPEFRLHLLLSPLPPDLTTYFLQRFEPQVIDIPLKLVYYITLLLSPFFYIALFRYRRRMWRVVLILTGILYIEYVNKNGYIGRGQVVMTIALIVIALWDLRPRLRPALIFGTVSLLPFILVASYVYGVVRISGQVGSLNFSQAIVSVVESEISFPRDVGMLIIESAKRVDFYNYIKWIITLPIPKILTGEITGSRVNYEIAEYVLGVGPGQKGWYVILPGLVSESVYIYGNYFFLIHGIFIGFIAAFIVRIIEGTPQLLFLKAHVVLLLSYVVNRAGISALLPKITNEFLLFYLYVFILIFEPLSAHRRSVTGMKETVK